MYVVILFFNLIYFAAKKSKKATADASANPRKRKFVAQEAPKELTLVDQKWGLPAPKKTKPSLTVDRILTLSMYVPLIMFDCLRYQPCKHFIGTTRRGSRYGRINFN